MLRADLPLEPGYVMTVEPGIYFIPALLQDPVLREQHRDAVRWDRVDARLGHVVGHEDAGTEPEQFRHPGDGPTVVAVGGRRERERTQRVAGAREVVDRRPLGFVTKAVDDRAVGGPTRTEHLERGEAEAARLDLEQHPRNAEARREFRCVDEWGGYVARQSAVEREGRAPRLEGAGLVAAVRVADQFVVHAGAPEVPVVPPGLPPGFPNAAIVASTSPSG